MPLKEKFSSAFRDLQPSKGLLAALVKPPFTVLYTYFRPIGSSAPLPPPTTAGAADPYSTALEKCYPDKSRIHGHSAVSHSQTKLAPPVRRGDVYPVVYADALHGADIIWTPYLATGCRDERDVWRSTRWTVRVGSRRRRRRGRFATPEFHG